MEGPVYSNSGPQQQGATLGQVAQTAQGAPPQASPQAGGQPHAPDIVDKYAHTLDRVRQLMEPEKMEMAVPPQHQSWGHLLGSVLSMGMLPLQEHEQAARYNAYAQQHNMGVEQKAAEMARALTSADEEGRLKDLDSKIKVAELNIAASRLGLSAQDAKLKKFLAFHKIANEDTFGPGDVDKAANVGAATGQNVVPAGGKGFRLTKNPTTGGYEMPAAGSPVANALGQGADSGAPPQTGPQAGESLADTLARQEAGRKKAATIGTPTGQTRTMAEMAPDVIDAINQVRQDMATAKPGPGASRAKGLGIALGMDFPGFQKYRSDIIALRGLFIKMHAGARGGGSPALIRNYTKMLDENLTPTNMSASLDAVEKYVRDVAQHGPEGIGSTTTTPTSSTTTTSGPGASQQTSTGKRYILINP